MGTRAEEIGVSKNFLDWLTDPIHNGGGAIIVLVAMARNLMNIK